MKTMVAGVDGCRAGGLCTWQEDGVVEAQVFTTFAQRLDSLDAATVFAVDIPEGGPVFQSIS